jgi:predicted SnoaL-like aldol condensation-catalyzing enzyme
MADLQINKASAEAFLDIALNQRDPGRAVAEHVGDDYIQHNPLGSDGAEGFVAWATWRLGQCPHYRVEFKRTIAEGDLVVAHTHHIDEPGSRGVAVIDIFRIADGRLVEHWDVIQPVPEESRNANGMF